MNENEIKSKILAALELETETEDVEFKDARGGLSKEVRKSLSAFGNTHGGIIVFGVEEDAMRKLSIVGTKNLGELQEKMTSISTTEMSQVLRLRYHHVSFEHHTLLAVYVPECTNRTKPYYVKTQGLPAGAYIREGNTDRRMTDEEMRSYVRNAQADEYDSHCAEGIVLADLSNEKISAFLHKSAEKIGRDSPLETSRDKVLKNIGILTEHNALPCPTFAGYLLFAHGKPQQKNTFARYIVRCVRYQGSGAHTEIVDKSDVEGTLDEQIDAMQAFILRNIPLSATIVGTKRVERYEYPEAAIREIVANAVIHRDYRITETYTQVNIFADRIEIFNPGNLPPGVTVENIRTAQISRNKTIARLLSNMDYLEEYGRGIDIVFAKMSEWNLLSPLFKNTSNSFKVILPGRILSQLNGRQIHIWELLLDRLRITRKELETLLPEVPQQTLNYDLRKMKDSGLIRKIGQSLHTHYETNF